MQHCVQAVGLQGSLFDHDRLVHFAPSHTDGLVFIVVGDVHSFHVASSAVKLARGASGARDSAFIALRFVGQSVGLLLCARERGLKDLPTHGLKKLYSILSIQPPADSRKPTTEVPLAFAICQRAFGSEVVAEQFLADVLKARTPTADTSLGALFFSATIFELHGAEAFEEGLEEDAELKAQFEQVRRSRDKALMTARASMESASVLLVTPACAGAVSSSSSSSGSTGPVAASAAPAFGRTRVFHPVLQTDGLSQAQANSFLSVGWSFTKDLRENRWRLRGPCPSGRSRSYGRGSVLDDCGGLRPPQA